MVGGLCAGSDHEARRASRFLLATRFILAAASNKVPDLIGISVTAVRGQALAVRGSSPRSPRIFRRGS